MARTLEQLDEVVSRLSAELEELRRKRSESSQQGNVHPFDRHAGCFTHDDDWLPMMDEIERARVAEAASEQAEADLVAA